MGTDRFTGIEFGYLLVFLLFFLLTKQKFNTFTHIVILYIPTILTYIKSAQQIKIS